MANPAGGFVWYELMTDNADSAAQFYGAVVGWTVKPGDPGAPIDYRHIMRSDGSAAGGMLQLTQEMTAQGAHPAWIPYFHVADVDGAVSAILADGGRVLGPRMDIAEGTIAMVADPFGTPFYVMTPRPPAGQPDVQSTAFAPERLQAVRWNELASPDLEGAKAFYAHHFGFTFDQSMPMGDMGEYCFIGHGGGIIGAIMQRHDPARTPLWLQYFSVPSVTDAKTAIETQGGTVIFGPIQVPTGEWIVVASDPQGATFGVVGPKGDVA